MSTTELLALAGSVVLVLLAAVLAVAETAFTHLGRARAEAIDNARSGKTRDRTRDEEGNVTSGPEDTDPAHAGVLVDLLDRRSQILNPVLLLVLVCHLGVATIVAVLAYDHWGLSGVVIALVVELVVIFVVAEAAPKTWALQHTDGPRVRWRRSCRALGAPRPAAHGSRGPHRADQRDPPGQGPQGGPVGLGGGAAALADVADEAAVIEAEERAPHRVDHRVRRHRRPRGDGAPARHGDRRPATSGSPT